MKIQYVFYIVGVLFIFATVVYFAQEFLKELPDALKLILLFLSVGVSFILAEVFRGYDK